MNVFVTGGAGYIGSVCVEELVRAGHAVSVFDSLWEGHAEAIHPAASFIQGDLADRAMVFESVRAAGPDAIVHFAAHALVGESMSHPGKYFQNNVAAGLNLLDAAVACRVSRIVFSSTCATYGYPSAVPITEDMPQNPINPYGESKKMFERILDWYRQIHGLSFAVFRYFNAAGATEQYGEDHRIETHLIPNLLKVALAQSSHCEIFGTDYPTPDGTCVRDFIHVSDLAAAHISALQSSQSGFYNLGNGTGSSVREVVDACRRISGRPIQVLERPRRPGDPPRLIASAAKARTELGWSPLISALDDIVASAWRWHLAHPRGYTASTTAGSH